MGLYTILKKHRLKDRQLRFLFLGLDAAGKSTIVSRLLSPMASPDQQSLKDISPTFGFKVTTIEFEKYKLNIWDVGGQKTLRAYWRNYFEQTDGVVWVVDSTDHERLHDCAVELHTFLQEERLMGASLLILANKRDLPNCISLDGIEKDLSLSSIQTHPWKIFPCSAITGENVQEGLSWLVHDIGDKRYHFD